MNCRRVLGLSLVVLSKSSISPMTCVTGIVAQNSHPLLETATQLCTLPVLAIVFLPDDIFLQFGTLFFNVFQFVKAYFTSKELDNRIRSCPALTRFENHRDLRTAKARFPTSACLTYCCSQHMFEVTDRRCFEHTAKTLCKLFQPSYVGEKKLPNKKFTRISICKFFSQTQCNYITRSSIFSSICGDSCVEVQR